jgi:hypothetical protein
MSTEPRDPAGEKPLKIRRGRVDSVDLYEIKDTELDLLERGSPADLQLNFAIFLLSLSFSAICALTTATFADGTVHTTFIVVAVVGILVGGYLLLSWARSRSSLKALCARIRSRIPPEDAPAPPVGPPLPPPVGGGPDQPIG